MATAAFKREVDLFRRHGGSLRMSDALRLNVNRKTLYALRDAGIVEPSPGGCSGSRRLSRSRTRPRHRRDARPCP